MVKSRLWFGWIPGNLNRIRTVYISFRKAGKKDIKLRGEILSKRELQAPRRAFLGQEWKYSSKTRLDIIIR
ncbi:MAG: hypothetical protein BA872_06920 [Desulfobacterales bacterium C00003060]|nr:MAG: hypothetical protein BA872_06920 [Desulfobacterales bacterium C00003060]OEU82979.1 MAG: hypothetical protein BA865_06165 [Desulfobacterales bacterium S5133MH4]